MTENRSPQQDPKETARQEWTGAAPFWQKWNHKFVLQTQAATELVVQRADLGAGMHVLDLASGTGEPALSLARSVGPSGRVVATDLVPEMLEAARTNAAAHGLAHIEFRVADAEHLPFASAEFDRVTCRFGVMFFPDIPRALGEVRRVLKPGGRLAFAAFGTLEENPFFAATLGPFLRRAKIPPPPPDAPHIFRFADPNKLAGALAAAGFRSAGADKQQISWAWPGTAEEAWDATRDLAAPFKQVMASLPPDQRADATREVLESLRRSYDGNRINFPATVVMATGCA